MAQPSHLYRRKGRSTYTVRRVVPEHLRAIIQKVELTRSTGETSLKHAERKSWPILAEFDREIENAERKFSQAPGHDFEQALAKANIPRDLFEHLKEFLGKEVPFASIDGMHEIQLTRENQEKLIKDYQHQLKETKLSLARGDTASFTADAIEWAGDAGFDLTQEQAQNLGPGIANAIIHSLKSAIANLEGEEEPPVLDPELLRQSVPTVGEAISLWLESKKIHHQSHKGEDMRASTARDYTGIIRLFASLTDDRPLSKYSRRDIAEYQDLLSQIPRYHNKDAKLRNLDYPAIIKITKSDQSIERLSGRSVQKHLSIIKQFFDWAIEREMLEINPCHGIKFKKRAKPKDQREAFTIDQLSTLFNTPIYRGCRSNARRFEAGETIIHDHRYWLPLLAAFTGARLEELAQLTREDIGKKDGVTCFRIHSDGEGHRVKSASAHRLIPMHSTLLKANFPSYCEKIARNPKDSIFPELDRAGVDQKLSFNFSKWFPRFLRASNITGVQFHSLRHTFITALRDNGVPEDIRAYLSGHSRNTSQQDRYAKDPSIEILNKAMSMPLYSELDISHIAYGTNK